MEGEAPLHVRQVKIALGNTDHIERAVGLVLEQTVTILHKDRLLGIYLTEHLEQDEMARKRISLNQIRNNTPDVHQLKDILLISPADAKLLQDYYLE